LRGVAAIEAFRQQTASATRSYLDRASEAELNSPREMISDPGQTRLLRPADLIMRIVTHIFNHQGQVLAMCRTIGKPNDKHDLDYPVDSTRMLRSSLNPSTCFAFLQIDSPAALQSGRFAASASAAFCVTRKE